MKINLVVVNKNTIISLLLDVVVRLRLICCTYPNLGISIVSEHKTLFKWNNYLVGGLKTTNTHSL